MNHYIELLKALGAKSDTLEKLKDEEIEIDYDEIAGSISGGKADYYKKIYEPKLSEAENKIIRERQNWKTMINKEFSLGFSSNELKEVKRAEISAKLKAKIDTDLEELRKGGDEHTNKRFNELTNNFLSLQKEHEALKESKESEIEEIRLGYVQKEKASQVSKMLNEKYESYTGWDKSRIKGYKKAMNADIHSFYKVEPDGSIFDKDGGPAKHPSGKPISAQHIDDVFEWHVKDNSFNISSNVGERAQGDVTLSGKKIVNQEKMTPEQLKYLERMKKQAEYNAR